MLRRLQKPLVLLVLVILAASTPAAGVVVPPNATVPAAISLVGSLGGVPAHSAGAFQVIVRDPGNNPLPGAHVVIDLSGCPDLHLCADQLDPGVDIDCAGKRVGRYTDALGSARFTLLGGSNGAGHAAELLGAGRVYEDGVLIGSPTVSAFDLDGVVGVAINDFSVWLQDFGTSGNPPFGRSDFDGSGSVGVNDLSVWLTAFGTGAQAQSCGATCP
jgi:hypothetical protein